VTFEAGLTYPEVGATRAGTLPEGYGHLERDVALGSGPAVFGRAVAALLGWRMHRAAGLTVLRSDGDAAPGVVVVLAAGRPPFRLTIPCRVVYTVDEPLRRGFAYGTLDGHPERGEESFLITTTEAGEVRFRIRAFSRPASLLARAGGPLSRRIQQHITDRYVRALRELSA